MAEFARNNNPEPTHGSAGWLVLCTVGLAAAGILGHALYGMSEQVPRFTGLQQAMYEFDTGRLAPAAEAFRRLADAGNADAAYWYGHALERGLGTPADAKAAVTQFTKAWSGGVTAAATQLGELYLNGNEVVPDFAKARSYLTDAADRGDARAALDLARMLREGIGGPADPVRAYAWLEIAALHGSAEARIERNRLLPTLSAAQQAEASQVADALEAALTRPAQSAAAPHGAA
jgi:TPR repeat protein